MSLCDGSYAWKHIFGRFGSSEQKSSTARIRTPFVCAMRNEVGSLLNTGPGMTLEIAQATGLSKEARPQLQRHYCVSGIRENSRLQS